MSVDTDHHWVEPGHVYLVGTPIGNLEDFSPRAQAVLRQVDRILCEDTRETEILCRTFDIHRPLVSFHAHNAPRRLQQVATWIAQGESLALVSDRGMPAISDPGQELMVWLYDNHIPFSVIPGPSAQVMAFAASGFPHPYVFWGFIPPSGKARRERLQEIQACPYASVIYEAPHHMDKTLNDLLELLGQDRLVVLGREMTKHFEEFWKGTLGELVSQNRTWKGEMVLVLGPKASASEQEPEWDKLIDDVENLVAAGHTIKEATQQIASQYHISRRELYNRAQKSRNN
ncbi:MAG: 16S rRNA (cytidine(1402)-2'-O)-methyltransferase [Sulfobacillus thermosulfidooxidans]|uniref:Ribosomal RNA small subunit methyltransferase I n=1 Tax=Sulfobacillus thermosulfidooxidans TaxID=28034 RepID=A0A2T2X2Q6_SULTH|nr:MAG: 16S rRNA (cytidine(1402)-2'-O)-methyltransferase [Sulfobacillus thermosulfidooxidans]